MGVAILDQLCALTTPTTERDVLRLKGVRCCFIFLTRIQTSPCAVNPQKRRGFPEKRWENVLDGFYAASLIKMAELKEEDAVQLHQEDANIKGKITHGFLS